MQNPLTFWIYSLCKDELQDDWNNIDHQGYPAQKLVKVVKCERIVNDPADNLCVGSPGNDGKYYQFDTYEAYHADSYFRQDFDKHGLYIESRQVQVDRANLINL